MKRKASDTDLPTKHLIADAVGHYEALLDELLAFGVDPQSVMSDYERALINAVETTCILPREDASSTTSKHFGGRCSNMT
jgi:hypothetical protein